MNHILSGGPCGGQEADFGNSKTVDLPSDKSGKNARYEIRPVEEDSDETVAIFVGYVKAVP